MWGDSRAEPAAEIAFIGDLMLARKVSAALRDGRNPEAFFGDVRPRLLAADAVVCNLECALTDRTKRHVLKAFHFLADPRTTAILTAGNVRCVALANNHSLDAGPGGLLDTLRHLDDAGVAYAGAGEDLRAASAPTTFRAGSVTIGLASITNTLRAFRAGPTHPGTGYSRIRADGPSGLLGSLVEAMDRRGADVRVLSIHWGPNFRPAPPRRYRAFARQAIDAGFDIVHGHSAHVVQAVEAYRNGLILYDTGDFLDDYWAMPGFRLDRSFLFLVKLAPGRRPQLALFPVSLTPCAVNYAVGREADSIRGSMIRRCRLHGMDFTEAGGALIAVPRVDAATDVGRAVSTIPVAGPDRAA
jgi:poly-gamma-glutamate synthesis protein (capsule biosynthesis protein)